MKSLIQGIFLFDINRKTRHKKEAELPAQATRLPFLFMAAFK
jgi:hypothetical protein